VPRVLPRAGLVYRMVGVASCARGRRAEPRWSAGKSAEAAA